MTASSGGSVRSDYRCSDCGYGVVVAIEAPPACPMCGGSTWDHAEWRPFASAKAELLEPAAAAAEPERSPA